MVTLQEYRVRHALYKTDPDLQAAHARHPWVAIFDDHEITNDAYATGAENHETQDDPDTSYTGPGEPAGVRAEGDFLARRAQAFQAYLEWMPVREPSTYQPEPHQGTQFFRRFRFGDLAELSVLDTRQNRSQQVPAPVAGALNPALADPARVLPEPEQLRWLTEGLTAGRSAWHLVGNQTVFARVFAARSSAGGPARCSAPTSGTATRTTRPPSSRRWRRPGTPTPSSSPATSTPRGPTTCPTTRRATARPQHLGRASSSSARR